MEDYFVEISISLLNIHLLSLLLETMSKNEMYLKLLRMGFELAVLNTTTAHVSLRGKIEVGSVVYRNAVINPIELLREVT